MSQHAYTFQTAFFLVLVVLLYTTEPSVRLARALLARCPTPTPYTRRHSTHNTERCAQVLQTLLARGTASLGRGVHTPGELNKLLARTAAELERFQQAR